MLLNFSPKKGKTFVYNLADELAGDDWHIKNRSSLIFFERCPLHAIASLAQSYNNCEILLHHEGGGGGGGKKRKKELQRNNAST